MPRKALVSYLGTASENVGGSTGTLNGVNFGVASANRVIAVVAAARATSGGPPTLSSVTIGGISASPVSGASAGGQASVSNVTTDIWYAPVPTGASGTVVLNYGAVNNRSAVYAFAIYTSNPTPFNGGSINNLAVTTVTASILLPRGGVAIGGSINQSTGNTTTFTNATLDADGAISAGASHDFAACHILGQMGSIAVTAASLATGNTMALSLASWAP